MERADTLNKVAKKFMKMQRDIRHFEYDYNLKDYIDEIHESIERDRKFN